MVETEMITVLGLAQRTLGARLTRHRPAQISLVLTLALAATAGADTPADETPRRFSLGLATLDLDHAPRFGLGVDTIAASSLDKTDKPADRHAGLTLTSGTSIGSERSAFDDPTLVAALQEERWAQAGGGVLERHAAAELKRLLDGPSPGSGVGTGGGVSVAAIVRAFKRWRQKVKSARLPDGARVPLDHVLTFDVIAEPGSIPNSINVLPLTLGWVGDAAPGSCDPDGRCVVERLPPAADSLLVRGDGAALVRMPPEGISPRIRLRPVGWLRLRPAGAETCVRVTDADTGLVVPVNRWLNPGRGEWVSLTSAGLPLLLPIGTYVVESTRIQGPPMRSLIQVKADTKAGLDV